MLHAVEEDRTGGFNREVFDDSDKGGVGTVFLRGCPQSCMPNPFDRLLAVHKDVEEVSLMLDIFQDSQVEVLLCGVPSFSGVCLIPIKILCACGFNLFDMIFSIALLGWLMRVIVR